MKLIRESHVVDDGIKYVVVDMDPGDTIPTTAIKIDGEWHIPGEMPTATPEGTAEHPERPRRNRHSNE